MAPFPYQTWGVLLTALLFPFSQGKWSLVAQGVSGGCLLGCLSGILCGQGPWRCDGECISADVACAVGCLSGILCKRSPKQDGYTLMVSIITCSTRVSIGILNKQVFWQQSKCSLFVWIINDYIYNTFQKVSRSAEVSVIQFTLCFAEEWPRVSYYGGTGFQLCLVLIWKRMDVPVRFICLLPLPSFLLFQLMEVNERVYSSDIKDTLVSSTISY